VRGCAFWLEESKQGLPKAEFSSCSFSLFNFGASGLSGAPPRRRLDAGSQAQGPAESRDGPGSLPALLSADAVRVVNHAMNGRSSTSFIDESRWARVVAALQPGDFVIMQFGHNDGKADKPGVYAAVRGSYQENLRRFVRAVCAAGATPVLVTPVARRKWSGAGELSGYPR